MMGELPMEDDRGKQRLADLKKYKHKRFECMNCRNQTFIMTHCSDFPFFNVLCSKCGSLYVK